MSNKVYDFLKWFALICIPAASTAIGTIGNAVGYEHTAVVVTIVSAVGVFIGACLGYSCANYNKVTE